MLPAASFIETEGHFTTWEGRGQRIRPVRGPIGSSRPDWEIFTGLAEAMGGSLGFSTLEELQEEMGGLLRPRDADGATAPDPSAVPPATEGLTLVTYPLLVDDGRLSVDASELRSAQEQEAFAELHPDDAAGAGVESGGMVRLRTEAGEAVVPARVTLHISRGAVFVPFNNPGLQANTLLSGSFTTSVTIEAAVPTDAAAGEES